MKGKAPVQRSRNSLPPRHVRDVAAQSHEAKRSILNFFATALGSAYDPAVTSALRTLSPFSGAATSSIVGRPERLDALGAAFVMRSRPTCSISTIPIWTRSFIRRLRSAAPVAGAGASAGCSGRDAITAFHSRGGGGVPYRKCGFSRTLRPRLAYHLDLRRSFGAAAACAKLLGLSADGIANAIGIAASQSAGIVENLPSAAKNVSVGNAARNGLFAALLAAEGYGASARAIEGPLGWARAMGDETRSRASGWRPRQQLGDRQEHLTSPIRGDCISCRHRRLLQIAREAEPGCRRYRVDNGAGFGAAACARRPSGSTTNVMRGSAFITAPPARCYQARREVPEFAEPIVFGPDIVSLRQKVRAELDTSLPGRRGARRYPPGIGRNAP